MQTWRKCSLLTSGIALLMCVLAGSSTASERRTAIPLDFLTTREASDPQISPDGGTVVFVLEEPGPQPKGEPWRGDQDLWRVSADGNAAPQRWISSPERDWSPRWSPDGKRLAFLSNAGSDYGRAQMHDLFEHHLVMTDLRIWVPCLAKNLAGSGLIGLQRKI